MYESKLTITVIEAARRLGISRGLAYQAAREGRLPVIRFGRRLLVPCKALDELLQNPASAFKQVTENQKETEK
jgi:excisionase family DNA binding protein